MKSFSAATLIATASAFKHFSPDQPCVKKSKVPVVTKPGEPLLQLSADDLPQNFTWSNVNGTNFLTNIYNQHIP
jgi:hypothetical protein